jgi:cytochrome bd ubiquinol oxidase subunit II
MILHELLDYDTLRLIWWALLGVLLIGFAVTDGFDLGINILSLFVAKTDEERRNVNRSIEAVWEGNQVWLILGGGAIFAAWPPLYAISFSGFYLAMFAILFALILRPVGFKYRNKREDAAWRQRWDIALFIAGLVPALIFGVAVGNVLQGVPFRLDNDLRAFYDGSFFGLLNPFALLCGLLSVSMLVMHGAAFLKLKTRGIVAERAVRYGSWAALVTFVLFALGGIALYLFVDGYRVTTPMNPAGPSNPLWKEVVREPLVWFGNYVAYPALLIVPALGLSGAILAFIGLRSTREVPTLLASALSVTGIIASVGVSMFPIILPSSTDPRSTLTVWDSSSSHMTLFIMLVSVLIFMPIITAYTTWVYKVLWGKVEDGEATSAY